MALPIVLLAPVLIAVARAQQVNLVNITAPYFDFSNTCIQVLNQAVSCDPALREAGIQGRFESDETLAKVCTSGCASSLATWVRRVVGACGQARYTDGRASVLAAFLGQTRLEDYSTLCLKDPQGRFCNAALQSAPASATVCHSCVASIISTRLQMPIGATQVELKSQYESMTSSCRIASMTVTPQATTTAWVTLPPTQTPACAGTMYTIQGGDNCRSVSLRNGISTVELLAANRLLAWCADFPAAGGAVCIPSAKVCKPYQLSPDLQDTCSSIASKNGATWAQIVSWNPVLGQYCENLERLGKAGDVICASTPGGAWVNPRPQESPVTTQTPETHFTLTPTDFSSAPSPTLDLPYPQAGVIDPIANGSVLDCQVYRAPPVKADDGLGGADIDSYKCSDFARVYGATMAQLLEWNPSLRNRTTAGGGDCDLWAAEQYCARRDEDKSAAGRTGACIALEGAETGARGTCAGFVEWHGLSMSAFLQWNPGLGSQCENFRAGTSYCVKVRGFRPADTIATCTRWHPTEAGNTCSVIEQRYGLSHARFVAWNPSVLSDCSGINIGYEYCVGTPQFPGTGG
ncbi:hypothetical protein RB595_004753 [Gaeumannomyces hyphopodioides]